MSGIMIDVAANTQKAQRDLHAVNASVGLIADTATKMGATFQRTFAGLGLSLGSAGLFFSLKSISSEFVGIENKLSLVIKKSEELVKV